MICINLLKRSLFHVKLFSRYIFEGIFLKHIEHGAHVSLDRSQAYSKLALRSDEVLLTGHPLIRGKLSSIRQDIFYTRRQEACSLRVKVFLPAFSPQPLSGIRKGNSAGYTHPAVLEYSGENILRISLSLPVLKLRYSSSTWSSTTLSGSIM